MTKDLRAKYAVRNIRHNLSAKRPVDVITFADEDGPPGLICGERRPAVRSDAVPPHEHEFYELTLCLEDGGVHETSCGSLPVKRGTAFVLCPGEVHAFRVDGTGRGHVIICDYLAEWLYPDVRGLLEDMEFVSLFLHNAVLGGIPRLNIPQWQVDEGTLDACVRELREVGLECERTDPSHEFLRLCLHKTMVRLHRAYKAAAPHRPLLSVEPMVRAALRHIEDCVLQCIPFSVSALAEDLRLGADGFSRTFKEATGSSPMDYYQHRRLRQACSSLLATNRSVTEIAQALGYCDAAHFSHLFKRYEGATPSEYRRNFGR